MIIADPVLVHPELEAAMFVPGLAAIVGVDRAARARSGDWMLPVEVSSKDITAPAIAFPADEAAKTAVGGMAVGSTGTEGATSVAMT